MDGAAQKAESLGLANDHGVRGALGVINARPLFAGEIGTSCVKWRVVKGRFAVWRRSQHDHVGVDGGDAEEKSGGDGLEGKFRESHSA
jgi:hypothetical protein